MNILILNWKDIKNPDVGGAEIIVYELAKRLVKDGHKVTWFSRNFKDGKRYEKIDGITIIRRGSLLTTYLYAPYYYMILKRKPDLVFDMSNTIFWQTPLWAYKSKKIAYLNQLAQEVFDYEYSWIMAKIGKFVERFQYITYGHTKFLCYSKSTKSDLEKIGISSINISLFGLGLDHSRYVPGSKAKYPLFLCVSRLVKMKRTDLAVKAFSRVIRKYPKAKLAIIGYGYDKDRLKEMVKEMDLSGNIFFVDKDNLFFSKSVKDQKVKIMQEAWALVFPSVKEGWGMTVTECAACGTPAIVTDVTGLRDSVVKDKTGIIVSANPSSDELASAMIKMIEKTAFRKKMSKDAVVWAKNFTWENSYSKFKNIINI